MLFSIALIKRGRSCAACRSIDRNLAKASKLPRVRKAWTVEDKLGGWGVAQDKFFAGKVRPRSCFACCLAPSGRSCGLKLCADQKMLCRIRNQTPVRYVLQLLMCTLWSGKLAIFCSHLWMSWS